jgi:TPP-dependent 2-oxoacid decarboxylase
MANYAERAIILPPANPTSRAEEPRRVIAMIGDGSFKLTAQELSTMIRYGMRPIIILVNNHGYIIEDAIQEGP